MRGNLAAISASILAVGFYVAAVPTLRGNVPLACGRFFAAQYPKAKKLDITRTPDNAGVTVVVSTQDRSGPFIREITYRPYKLDTLKGKLSGVKIQITEYYPDKDGLKDEVETSFMSTQNGRYAAFAYLNRTLLDITVYDTTELSQPDLAKANAERRRMQHIKLACNMGS